MSLFDLSLEFRELMEASFSSDEASENLDRINYLLQEKTDKCYFWLESKKSDLATMERFIEEAKLRKKALENSVERFENYIKSCLQASGQKELVGENVTFKLRAPSSSVLITDERLIPAKFTQVETKVTIKKAEIAKALKAGEIVRGAELLEGQPGLIAKVGK
jgi:hypothetical protein